MPKNLAPCYPEYLLADRREPPHLRPLLDNGARSHSVLHSHTRPIPTAPILQQHAQHRTYAARARHPWPAIQRHT